MSVHHEALLCPWSCQIGSQAGKIADGRVLLGPHRHASLTKHSISDAGGKREFPPFTELAIAADVADAWRQSADDALGQAAWEFGAQAEEWTVPDLPENF